MSFSCYTFLCKPNFQVGHHNHWVDHTIRKTWGIHWKTRWKVEGLLMEGCVHSLIHHYPPFFPCTIYGNTADTFWEIRSHILRNIIAWWSSQCHMMIILMDGCNPSTSLIHHNPPFFSCTIHGNTADTFWEIQSHILRNIITYMYWSSKYHAMIIPMRWMDVSPPPP